MKLKISEEQARRLKLINENTNPLTQFEQHCTKLIAEINKVYSKVININVIEILNNEVSISDISKHLDKIEDSLRAYERKAYDYVNALPEQDLDAIIDDAYYKVNQKLTPLQLMVMDLERFQNSAEEHSLTEPFNDVKPLDIS